MSRLCTRLDHRPRAPSQAGARSTSRLDWDPARSLPRLREDLHFPSAVFSPLHALQLTGSLSGASPTLGGAVLLGRGDAHAQRSRSAARFFHAPPLVERPGPLSTGSFLSAPNTRLLGPLASAWRSGGSQCLAVVGADSGSAGPLAPASLRVFFFRPPSLPGNAGRFLLRSSPEAEQHHGRGYRTTQTAPSAARLFTAAELERTACGSG
jgi:hypothetical protein